MKDFEYSIVNLHPADFHFMAIIPAQGVISADGPYDEAPELPRDFPETKASVHVVPEVIHDAEDEIFGKAADGNMQAVMEYGGHERVGDWVE